MAGVGDAGKEEAKGKKRPRRVFVYGNYKTYYGYRIDRNAGEDPRLSAFRKEWFQGKDCLDIGCNQGLITINIAKKFSCSSILGVDIDGGLIADANRHLQKMAKTKQTNARLLKPLESGVSNGTDTLALNVPQTSDEEVDAPSSKEESLLQRVSFRKENFVESLEECSEMYDTILCLSVTKWIHLNWGDDGLIKLFVKIWRFLRPGGLLLLEPQPWSSYLRKQRVSETTKENFSEIFLRPHHFREILLDKIGFRSVEVITERLSGSVAGFDRPIFAFYK